MEQISGLPVAARASNNSLFVKSAEALPNWKNKNDVYSPILHFTEFDENNLVNNVNLENYKKT